MTSHHLQTPLIRLEMNTQSRLSRFFPPEFGNRALRDWASWSEETSCNWKLPRFQFDDSMTLINMRKQESVCGVRLASEPMRRAGERPVQALTASPLRQQTWGNLRGWPSGAHEDLSRLPAGPYNRPTFHLNGSGCSSSGRYYDSSWRYSTYGYTCSENALGRKNKIQVSESVCRRHSCWLCSVWEGCEVERNTQLGKTKQFILKE